MPCKSDYLEPNRREIESKRVARLLVYVYTALDRVDELDVDVIKAAKNTYGNTALLEPMVVTLCTILRGLDSDRINEIVYDGRKPLARDLADWWDEHQEADRKRLAKQKQIAVKEKLRKQAIDKLTPDELAALLEED